MAAPMRNPPGGTIHPTPATINFDTDDNSEWDIGVGDLIIDLDADIEKESDNMASATPLDTTQTSEQDHRATLDNKGLKMKIKRTKPGTKTCEAKHEIVKSAHQVSPVVSLQTSVNDGNGKNALQNGSIINMSGKRNIASSSTSSGSNSSSNSNSSASGNHKREKRESGGVVNTGPGPPEDVEMTPEPEETDAQTVPKKRKEETKDMLDVCVGTSVGTITEPDCLGPCEPGTSVTLEGIVWHETEGGVLVVNVTWRGKTYVGTLLDCTKHDWAPPRFCDSPTEELDSRTPKGRGKRGRGQTTAGNTSLLNDLSNFTETRSSVHSKLRNGGGGNKTTRRALTESPNVSLPAPTKIDKRKNRFEEITESQAIVIPQVKKTKSTVSVNNHSPPSSPILLECPEPNCNKKYKHANGLKYHQSHAHGGEDKEEKNTISTSENDDSSNIDPPSPCGNITEKVVSIKKDEIIESCSPVKDESLQEMENVSPAPLNSFKVKPASALMPEDKKVNSNFKRRSTRSKSPTAQDEQPTSPAYSDISDDGNTSDKNKDTHMELDKKNTESMQFGIYPFFNQQQYVRPSEPVKSDEKIATENENAKREITPICEKAPEGSASQHYNYPFGYMTTGFQYGVESGFAIQPEDKEDHLVSTKTNNDSKSSPILMTNKSQILHKDNNKHSTIVRPQSPHNMSRDPPILQHAPVTHPHTSAIPNQGTTQNQSCNDNHQILKESIEMKEQMRAGFIYREEDVRRYYMYPDNRRKEPLESTPPKLQAPLPTHLVKPSKSPVPVKPPVNPSNPIKVEDFIKKEDPNSNKPQQKDGSKVNDNHPQYAYIHSGYLQSNPYAGLTFDSSHPVYRNMSPVLVPSPYGAGAYLHRFHNPEDLSRGQNQNPKALDLLQHANQFYPHKIHELQERALKSPTPKTNQPARDPIAVVQTNCSDGTPGPDKTNAEKSKIEEGKEAPPPQHHVHTHHHTHVGLGYPIMAPQYPAPFGAGVNAAVNVINQFPPK